MLSRIFVDRPIFAWVIAIIVMMSGIGGIMNLPVAQYPDIAPPQVTVRATYPGASAETIQNSVTQVIEQSLTGINGLLYFSSSSTSRGQVAITITFEKGVDPDIAQVQVQNQVQVAISRLPTQVQQQGLVVRKSNPDMLMIVGVYDSTDKMTNRDVSDYMVSNLQDAVSRLDGVGDTNVFGSQYAMRIWLNPAKLASYSLTPADVITAIQSQNTEVAAGEIGGQPQPDAQMLNATVTAQSRLQTADQFAKIVLKSQQDGGAVVLSDVARVELGSENYNARSRVNRHPGAGLGIFLAPGSDALKTAELVKAKVTELSADFPPGMKVAYANDTTDFIKLSISEVVKTLGEAIILVIIVMFVFLQSWRATLVPAIAVPVVLLGTFGVLYVAGFSINTMTLFALVLAIGLLVDDAIVVVENVERLMEENPGMTPREATLESMKEITMALIAIAMILSAVFLPMAFFGGSTGVIYRQFSLTVISAMVLSVLVALILSPAITANALKAKKHHDELYQDGFGRRFPGAARLIHGGTTRFNRGFAELIENYRKSVRWFLRHKPVAFALYGVVVVLLVAMFIRLPTGFLPTEDQGAASVQFQLPPGATQGRTAEVQQQIEKYFAEQESKNVKTIFTVSGGGGGLNGQNTGQGFVNFVDWSERTNKEDSANEVVARASGAFHNFRDARVFALIPPAIRGLGQSDGFTMQLLNTSGLSRAEFNAARDKLLEAANKDPGLSSVRLTELPDMATLKVETDARKLAALGLSQADVNSTLATAWGGRYVNDFVDRGRVKRVYIQGDAEYRHDPGDLSDWYVRGSNGQMAPFSAFSSISWAQAPTTLSRFNGVPSYEFQGSAAAGGSSGQAMAAIEKLAKDIPGTTIAWSGLSYQERMSSGQAPLLYALSLLVVFLCLAALYESWSIPVAVMLVVPLGLVGAIAAVTLRGLINDVYLQIGLLTTMGLAAKNGILIVEFAEQARRRGLPIAEAAVEAARIRLRPILMTSLAFIFGVLPLAISTGAGANSRIAIGTTVIGGMITATALAVFYIPLFYILVMEGMSRWRKKGPEAGPQAEPA